VISQPSAGTVSSFHDAAEHIAVVVEGVYSGARQANPRLRSTAQATLGDLDISGRFQRGEVLGQQRVTDVDGVSEEAEVEFVGRRQCGHYRQPDRSVDDLV
jgi:hypothetical protein